MDATYQPTTEPTSPEENARCTFGSIWPRSRRNHDDFEDDDEVPKKTKRLSRRHNYRYCIAKINKLVDLFHLFILSELSLVDNVRTIKILLQVHSKSERR